MTKKKPAKGNQFTPSQSHALPFLIAASSIAQGATDAGVSKKQAWEWLKNPKFKQAISQGKEEVFSEALQQLKSAAGTAVTTLLELMQSQDERVKLSAAEKVLGYAFKAKETYDLETRLAAIEETLSEEKL